MLQARNPFVGRKAAILVALGSLFLISACGGATPTPDTGATSLPAAGTTPETAPKATPATTPGTTAGTVTDKAGLISALQSAGITVTSAGKVQQPFLSVPGEAFQAGSEVIQVFEYPGESAASADASKIKPDGTIAGSSVGWMAQPHFYHAGRLIVIYVGTDQRVLAALDSAMGPAFATGPNISGPKIQPAGTGTP